ncbi:hypothetical protein BH09ACT7_BH09ACT7_15490 [soil metagenome]
MSVSDVYRHSLVIAFDYRVPDPSRVGPLLERRTAALAQIGAHHVLVYRSIHEHGRVLVMTGVHSREPIVDLMRSRVLFDWFDSVGVEEIPAIFAGEIIERFDLTEPESVELAPGVVVAGIVSVDDVAVLTTQLRLASARFKAFGIRKMWVFQAFDDSREVLILQEIDDEASARRWMDNPDVATEWMTHAGLGVYPPLFVGEFDRMVKVDGAD